MTIKKTKVKVPKIAYLGFTIEGGYIDDFGYCRNEADAKKTYSHYLKVENWPDPDQRIPGICVGSIQL